MYVHLSQYLLMYTLLFYMGHVLLSLPKSELYIITASHTMLQLLVCYCYIPYNPTLLLLHTYYTVSCFLVLHVM